MIEEMSIPKPSAPDTGFRFKTPANQIDFPTDSTKQGLMDTAWNNHLNGFVQQGILGNPWTATNVPQATNYFNPIDTPVSINAQVAVVQWGAFPGRIKHYNPSLKPEQILSLGDTGYLPDGKTSFPNITANPCTGKAESLPYGPYGPRGWQDEYCEWCVTRNSKGQITRIDFTCENPEYWNTLWSIDPLRVLQIYRSTLDNSDIQMEDLMLMDGSTPVIDPSTGNPAYNPLNKWNTGTNRTQNGGGAMHLTSTPNTLQTEIGLAATATPQRTPPGNANFNSLICCAQYGQPYRNSDPNIGGTINSAVGKNNTVTLTNPPGLYIQIPDFGAFQTPDGTDAGKFWMIKRGKETMLGDDKKPLPGNFILHAVFEVPAKYGYTVSDIRIGIGSSATPIVYGGQVAQSMLMHILATTQPQPAGQACSCVTDLKNTPTTSQPQPLQLFHESIYQGMKKITIPNVVQQPMTLLSNSTMIPPIVKQGDKISMVLVVTGGGIAMTGYPLRLISFAFDGTDLTGTYNGAEPVNYAVPGNSYPDDYIALFLDLTVSPTAKLGLRSLGLKGVSPAGNPILMPAMLEVVAS
jgi:hypothetical protein